MKKTIYIIAVLNLWLTGCAVFNPAEKASLGICPVVFDVQPTQVRFGDTLFITGRNFTVLEEQQYQNNIFVNQVPADILRLRDDEIQVLVPQISGSNLVLEIEASTCNWSNFGLDPTLPSIASISPTSGPMDTEVTISGTNFRARNKEAHQVKFNGVVLPDSSILSVPNDQTIIVKVPQGTESGQVSVVVDGQTALGPDFTYVFTAFVTRLAGQFGQSGSDEGFVAKFGYPTGIDIMPDGNLIVADRANQTIRKIEISSNGARVEVIAGITGTRGTFNNVNGLFSTFNWPTDVVVEGSEAIYVADRNSFAVRKISLAGSNRVTTLLGDPTEKLYKDGKGNVARFRGPEALALINGNLYIADKTDHRVRKYNVNLDQVTTVAGDGSIGLGIGSPSSSQVSSPAGLTPGFTSGEILIATQTKHQVRSLDPNNNLSYLIGNQDGTAEDGNGNGLNSPVDMVLDKFGNLYITESGKHRIRVRRPNGDLLTLAGSGTAGDADGKGTAATFDTPMGITYDAQRHILYVADAGNFVIRKIELR
ncbi:MAG: IPT/TIG domain-containing protein [Bacteroidota bacterium]